MILSSKSLETFSASVTKINWQMHFTEKLHICRAEDLTPGKVSLSVIYVARVSARILSNISLKHVSLVT